MTRARKIQVASVKLCRNAAGRRDDYPRRMRWFSFTRSCSQIPVLPTFHLGLSPPWTKGWASTSSASSSARRFQSD
jgi:hypothetical protein